MRESTPMKIKKLRTERKLTQQQVAYALGISRVAVSKWESGDTKDLKRDNLVGLTKLFNVSLEELLDAEPVKPNDDIQIIPGTNPAPRPARLPHHQPGPGGNVARDRGHIPAWGCR